MLSCFFLLLSKLSRVHVSPLMTISWMRPLLCDGPHCWLVIFGLSGDDVSPPELLTSIQPFIFVGSLHTRVFLLADFATSMFSRLFPIAGNIGRTTNKGTPAVDRIAGLQQSTPSPAALPTTSSLTTTALPQLQLAGSSTVTPTHTQQPGTSASDGQGTEFQALLASTLHQMTG